MDVKEVINYIAEEDIEVNLTLQVGGSDTEELKQELEQIKDLLGGHVEEESDTDDEEPESADEESAVGGKAKEAQEKSEIENAEEETDIEEKAEEFLDNSDEDFEPNGRDPVEEPRDPEDEDPDMGPTEKQRTEAGADFNELFGDV